MRSDLEIFMDDISVRQGQGLDKFIAREKNFFGGDIILNDPSMDNLPFYDKAYDVRTYIQYQHFATNLDKYDLLKSVIETLSNELVKASELKLTGENLQHDLFDVVAFTLLCTFIHTTKRIKGLSIREFLIKRGYTVGNHDIDSYIDKLRKMRHRLFAAREIYIERSEWSAIPCSSEHELSIIHSLIETEDESMIAFYQTYKRIGNLYNDINNALKSDRDDGFIDRLNRANKRYISKVKKIKYADYLALNNFILGRISDDRQYYGINLYRVEKLMKIYNLTNVVNELLNCRSEMAERKILITYELLESIPYPKIYKHFGCLEDQNAMSIQVAAYNNFICQVVGLGRLILDELIENGYFGDQWEDFFLEIINELSERVFYSPKDIDYSVTDNSQDKFMQALSHSVGTLIIKEINNLIKDQDIEHMSNRH